MLRLLPTVLLLAASVASAAPAMQKDSRSRWFRYYDDKNQPTVTDSITEEHIVRGYESLDAGMRVLERVPARRILSPEEQAAAKAERDAALQRAKDDKQLLRLYARPVDAEQARDRQIEALQVRIDFSTNSLSRLRQSRAADAQRAATFERRGKPVPAELQKSISTLDKQIKQMQGDIENRKTEQERIRKEFGPIVQRLSELTGIPASKPSAQQTPAAASPPQGTK